jgi:hypothetical protein
MDAGVDGAAQADYWGGMTGTFTDLLVTVAILVVVGLLVVVLLLLVVFAVELALLALAVAFLLRPWGLVAETDGPPPERREWRVRGWRGSKRAVAEAARELAQGVPAAPAEESA